jgi:hypothetical protein
MFIRHLNHILKHLISNNMTLACWWEKKNEIVLSWLKGDYVDVVQSDIGDLLFSIVPKLK